MPRYSYGDDLKERVWNLLEALLSQVDPEFKGGALVEGVSLQPSWRKGHRPTLEVKAQLADLSKLSKQSKYKLSIDDVRDALRHYLPDFLEILKDKRQIKQGRGSENWHFILTLWSTELQENQKQFYIVWERKKIRETKVPVISRADLADDNWHNICLAMLEKQKRLTTNELLCADEDMKFELDEIHVPLALVQRTKPDKRSKDEGNSPEQGSQLYKPRYEQKQSTGDKEKQATGYEEKQRFKHEEFLVQVLQEGKGQSKGRRIALIGEPGAGKTTLLQSIAFWISKNNLGLPIWISLADLQQADGNLKEFNEYLLCDWLNKAIPKPRLTSAIKTDFTNQFESRQVWLLLDGVDEVVEKCGSILNKLQQQLQGWVAKARVVLTCRLNIWETNVNALEDFETYRLLDFDYPEQVREFICRWFRKSDPDKGEQLSAELDKYERQRIQDLVRNPLRLALLCSTWHRWQEQGGLPDTKAKLYKGFVDYFYDWKHKKHPTSKPQRQTLNKALGELSKWAIDQPTSRFRLRLDQIPETLAQTLGDKDEEGSLLWLATTKLGWLNNVGLAEENPNEAVYAFFHPTFQEYFAALAIADWDFFLPRAHDNQNPKPVSKKYHIFEPQWKEVILLWLGREDVAKERKEEFINVLLEFEDGLGWNLANQFYYHRAFYIAALGIAEFRNYSRADEIVALIVLLGFGYFNAEEQKWYTYLDPIAEGARATLLQTDCGRAINKLIHLLENTDNEDIRWIAAESLGKIDPGNQQAIEVFDRILEISEDEDIRWSAAESLGKIDPGNQQAIEALIRLLVTTSDIVTRWSIPGVLGKICKGNQQVIETLVRILETSEDEDIRRVAAETLGEVGPGNQQAIEALIRLLVTTSNIVTRWSIPGVLGEIDPGNQKVIEALVRILETTQDEDICRISTETLGEIGSGNQKAIEALVQILETTQDDDARWSAADSLGKIGKGNQRAIKALVRILETSADEDIRRVAAETLGEIDPGNQQAIEVFVRILETTESEHTRWSATITLGEIGKGEQRAIEALVRILETSEDEHTRWLAADNLGEICPGNQQAIEMLIRILETTEDENTRNLAADSLGKIDPGNQQAIEALVRILEATKHEANHWIAAESLGKIDPGNQQAIETLVRILETSENESRRSLAAYGLEKIGNGNQKAIKAFVRILETAQDEYARRRATDTLEKIGNGNPQAIEALIQILETTQDESTRRGATDTLEKIGNGNPQAIEALIRILETTQDESTRRRATDTLEKIGNGNPQAIKAFVRILETTQDEYTRRRATDTLGKIGTGNEQAIEALVRILETTQDKYTRRSAAESLIRQKRETPSVVSALKHCLADEVYESNFDLFEKCYKLIWDCAQNMTYPAFYQAWHQQEGVEKTSTSDSQTLNQADLPQSLQSAITHDPQLGQIIHLICIDGSQFIEPDRPAAEIYDQMLDQNCLECDRVPETMPALKLYWNSLKRKSDKRLVLVFYASSTDATPDEGTTMSCPYSEAFLTVLSKFGREICVITEQRFERIPLKSFASSQTIEEVLEWIRAMVVEE